MVVPSFVKGILFALIPKKRISAHIIGVIIGAVAAVVGLSATDLKQEICKNEPIQIEATKAESK